MNARIREEQLCRIVGPLPADQQDGLGRFVWTLRWVGCIQVPRLVRWLGLPVCYRNVCLVDAWQVRPLGPFDVWHVSTRNLQPISDPGLALEIAGACGEGRHVQA